MRPAAALRLFVLVGAAALLGTQFIPSVPDRGTLKVRLVDPEGNVTAARVNVLGADHGYYEPDPASTPLSPYSLKRMGNRHNRGPARYYGSFFYTDGSFEVKVPPGPVRVEARKGYTYWPARADADVEAGKTTSLEIPLRPMLEMSKLGWASIDTHIHFARERLDDPRFLQLLAAEDVRFGHSISANDTSKYSPTIDSQLLTIQRRGYGPKTHQKKGGHELISGHEYRSANLGHVTQIMIDSLVPANGMNTDTRAGPAIATIYDQTLEVSGALGHAHGGYDQELLSDIVLGKSDWVELLQFGFYRGIKLDGYYLALNSGFRYPIGGASDYPYNRTLADSLMYAIAGPEPTFASVTGALLRAESFASSGPLLFLTVGGKGPGSDLRLEDPGEVAVEVMAASSFLPLTQLEIVMNGNVVADLSPRTPRLQVIGRAVLEVEENSWIAARTHGPQDARAHTNPVWITLDGRRRFDPGAAAELSRRIGRFNPSRIGPDTKAVLDRAKEKARRIAEMKKHPPDELPNYPRDSKIQPGSQKAELFPVLLARPEPPARIPWLQGIVMDPDGNPVAGAGVRPSTMGIGYVTDEAGRFQIPDVPTDRPLSLRVTKKGWIATHTSYLNPRSAAGIRIVCMKVEDARKRFEAWAKSRPRVRPEHFTSRPILLLDLPSGVSVKASPSATEFGPLDDRRILGSVHVDFRDSPDEDNSVEPNLVLSFEALGKDRVAPVFAGQITYIQVSK